ncbi:MAG: IS30 family transposase [Clostridia bacterium]|nr:IS30 family transposase [Clostridia bacterium]
MTERKFKHLTKEKRAQIEILIKQGIAKTEIARLLGIARSTLYKELERGTVDQMRSDLSRYQRYFSDAGQRVYEERRQNSRKPLKLIQAWDFVRYADEKMKKGGLSPDAICGRARIENIFKEVVCTKTLYNYIDQCLLGTRNIDLPMRVKRRTKREKDRTNRRLYGMSIEQRPEEVERREEFGHGEIDTIKGKKESSAALLSIDERYTRRRYLVKISSCSKEAVREGIEKLRERHGENFSGIFKTMTSDNGSEFAELSDALPEAEVYYAHPYSAFERGTNEKQNSLVRRFFPKGTDFDTVSDEAIAFVEDWINNLPRKIFNYRTSSELFDSVRFDLAI